MSCCGRAGEGRKRCVSSPRIFVVRHRANNNTNNNNNNNIDNNNINNLKNNNNNDNQSKHSTTKLLESSDRSKRTKRKNNFAVSDKARELLRRRHCRATPAVRFKTPAGFDRSIGSSGSNDSDIYCLELFEFLSELSLTAWSEREINVANFSRQF